MKISVSLAVAPAFFMADAMGKMKKPVFAELCQIVEETVNLYETEKRPLPPATSGYDWANTIANTPATN